MRSVDQEADRGWRCFVAVPIDEVLRADLAARVASWRAEPGVPDLRWTDPAGWHVTLAFLGSISPSQAAPITARLAPTARSAEPFDVTGGGLGAFPSTGRARVLWYRIVDSRSRLPALADAVRANLADLVPRLDAEGEFRAHLTLGRARDRRGIVLRDWLDAHAAPGATLAVDRLILFRSHLGRRPARYEELAAWPLGATAAGVEPRRAEASVHG